MKATTSLYIKTGSPSHSMFATPKYRVRVLMKSQTKRYTFRPVKCIRNVVKRSNLRMDKFKSKTGLQYQKNSHYLAEVKWEISDLPFVQNND